MARDGERFHSRADDWAVSAEEQLRALVAEKIRLVIEKDKQLQEAQLHISELRIELRRLGERIDALEVMMLGEREN